MVSREFFAHPFEFFGLHNAVITDDGNIVDGSHGYANVIDIGFQLTFAAIATALISGAIAERVKFGTWLTFVGFVGHSGLLPISLYGVE